jgi:phospholipase/carboxylesterase
MEYIYKKGQDDHPIILLFHGTGGDENDLLPIANSIDENASVISFRGDVDENGSLRFFKRKPNGQFDYNDLIMRTDKLDILIKKLSVELGYDCNNLVAIGYSNGANIIGSLLFAKEICFKGAILMHPMVARTDVNPKSLDGRKILITAGINDPICPVGESRAVNEILKAAKAEVSLQWFNDGHRLTFKEVEAAKKWYNEILLTN